MQGKDKGRDFNALGQSLLNIQTGKSATMIQSHGVARGEWGEEVRGGIFDAVVDPLVNGALFLEDFKFREALIRSGDIKPGVGGIVLPANREDFYTGTLGRTARPENSISSQTAEERVRHSLNKMCSGNIAMDELGNKLTVFQGKRAAYQIFLHEHLTPSTRDQWVNEAKCKKKAPSAARSKAPPAAAASKPTKRARRAKDDGSDSDYSDCD